MLRWDVAGKILGAAMEVHRTLGPGFVELVYRNALAQELRMRGLSFQIEREVQIFYKDLLVGRHRLDLLVEDSVIVELKAVAGIIDVHLAQALSYLKATGMHVSLVVNFGEPKLAWRRLVNSRN